MSLDTTLATVRQISDPDQREKIAREILEALPDWFENVEAREGYIRDSRERITFAAEKDGRVVGFLCLKETGKATVELAVMGIRMEYHRKGIGSALFGAAKAYAVAAGYEFMQVKTVRMGMYEDYDRTNRFYLSLGFRELEVIPEVWGDENPCQIYVMYLRETASFTDLIMKRRSYRGKFRPDPVPRSNTCSTFHGLPLRAAPRNCRSWRPMRGLRAGRRPGAPTGPGRDSGAPGYGIGCRPGCFPGSYRRNTSRPGRG